MEDRHSAAGQATNCARRTVPVTKIPTKSKDKSKDRPEDSKLLSQKERRGTVATTFTDKLANLNFQYQ